ncbi:MAG: PTS sugar transporter subunit IIB [Erysipelothrix sp.]|nr:PTS sugar transporter subunit IIB [Erysipelothrix sp.]
MPVVLARVDERLVHGQIITSWTKQLKVDVIYIIDDNIANDPFIYQVLTLSAPSGLSFEVLKVEQAAEKLRENTKENILLLFKSVQYPLELIEAGYPLAHLNLGNLGAGPSRKSISKNVSVSKEEIKTIENIIEAGCEVYLQMLYSEPKINVQNVL